MESLNAALLINCVGFAVGIALYGLLGSMVFRHHRSDESRSVGRLLLATSFLGLVWNTGELTVFILQDIGSGIQFSFISAAAYSALGFLPSVVVHSAQNETREGFVLTYIAYAVSIFAAILHFYAAVTQRTVPSELAFIVLSVGAVSLAIGLAFLSFRNPVKQKAIWTTALLIFVVSSLHFLIDREGSSWIVELVAHQSSLPLALVILYQNYRFAFADLFLKRAISLMLLALVAFSLYIWVAAPMLRYHETHDRNDVLAISLILFLWIATALIYPSLHNLAIWLVDTAILRRADYHKLQAELSTELEMMSSSDDVLQLLKDRLSIALTAGAVSSKETQLLYEPSTIETVQVSPDRAEITIPTAESPFIKLELADLQGGRRLLSDETSMLETVSLMAARRLDALRVMDERFERQYREQEISKLAAQAQLSALRAQINPHFLFNALTTIGYLIKNSPDKAFQTLLQLTKLLRSVLRAADEFCPLDEEIKMIESYLDIEKARFEERLTVNINIDGDAANSRIPGLILQPLVENAVKHGISENRNGGVVSITASLVGNETDKWLKINVKDTGSGKRITQVNEVDTGVGLKNVRGRLASHYGENATLQIDNNEDGSVTATLMIPQLHS